MRVAREYKTVDALDAMCAAGLKLPWGREDALRRLREIDAGAITGSAALKSFLEAVSLEVIRFEKSGDAQKFFLIGEKAYYGNLDKNVYTVLPGTCEVLNELSSVHILVLVSKGEERLQFHKMVSAGIASTLFRKIIITSVYDKKVAYQEVIKHFQISPLKSVVIGDKFDTDLMPATLLGMKTIHVQWGRGRNDEKGKKMATASVKSLREILAVLAKIEKGGL